MAIADINYENITNSAPVGEMREPTEIAYHCHIATIREDDGSYTAIVLNLPGAASEGATEDEAMQNVQESICGLIESYKATGDLIPWKDSISQDVPADAIRTKWILVNV